MCLVFTFGHIKILSKLTYIYQLVPGTYFVMQCGNSGLNKWWYFTQIHELKFNFLKNNCLFLMTIIPIIWVQFLL